MQHNMTQEYRDAGTCSDHYCTGHTNKFVVCSCGWEQRFYTDTPSGIMQRHMIDILAKESGIEFSTKS